MIPKFRTWDKTTNQMRGCYGFNDMEKEVYVCNIANEDFNGKQKTVHAIKRNFNDVTLMQSTGLTDKNGVEIFEGDIIKDYGLTDKTYVLVKKDFYFSFESIKEFKDGRMKNGLLDPMMLAFCTKRGHFEVIGNIYEDKELLEVE